MCGGRFLHHLGGLLAEASVRNTSSASQNELLMRQKPVEMTTACPNCQAFVPARYTWCPECGANLKFRPCTYCGQSLHPGAGACPNCGAPAGKAG